MKKLMILPAFLLLFISCSEEDFQQLETGNFDITNIAVMNPVEVTESQEIVLTVNKPNCYASLLEIKKTVSNKNFNYELVYIKNRDIFCAPEHEFVEQVKVIFAPTQSGEHTLRFSINSVLLETRNVLVTVK